MLKLLLSLVLSSLFIFSCTAKPVIAKKDSITNERSPANAEMLASMLEEEYNEKNFQTKQIHSVDAVEFYTSKHFSQFDPAGVVFSGDILILGRWESEAILYNSAPQKCQIKDVKHVDTDTHPRVAMGTEISVVLKNNYPNAKIIQPLTIKKGTYWGTPSYWESPTSPSSKGYINFEFNSSGITVDFNEALECMDYNPNYKDPILSRMRIVLKNEDWIEYQRNLKTEAVAREQEKLNKKYKN